MGLYMAYYDGKTRDLAKDVVMLYIIDVISYD